MRLLLALVFGLLGAPWSSPAANALTEQLDAANVPNGAVAVVSGGTGPSVEVGTRGSDVTGRTPFVIGSTTKSFTALAVMQLVGSGHVGLEDPVVDHVPELTLAPGEPVGAITVRDLLQQTSGLDDLSGGPVIRSAAEGTPLDAVAELAGAELASEPGASWRYANINYVLAGLVVERASGTAYGRYVTTHILRPLGMDDTYAGADRARDADLAVGHQFWFGIPVGHGPAVSEAMLAAGYLASSAQDLGRYLAMYLAGGLAEDGTRVVSADALGTMLAPGPEAHLGSWAGGSTARYAMGWFVGGPFGEDVLFHPGNAPDASSMIALAPERDLAVATLVGAGHELPVPGNPSIADSVSANVVHAALGQPAPDLPSLWGFYAVFDLVVLVLLALAGLGLVRSVRDLRRHRPRRHLWRAVAGVVARLAATMLLLLLPLTSLGWAGLWTWAPDLALVLVVLAALLAVTAAARFALLVTAQPRRPALARGTG